MLTDQSFSILFAGQILMQNKQQIILMYEAS